MSLCNFCSALCLASTHKQAFLPTDHPVGRCSVQTEQSLLGQVEVGSHDRLEKVGTELSPDGWKSRKGTQHS